MAGVAVIATGVVMSALPASLAILAVCVFVAPFVPLGARALRALPRGACLRQATPLRRHRRVHSLASMAPGAGAELLSSLSKEADAKSWSLLLEASNDRLARYYSDFGFAPVGEPVTLADGAAHVLMWRAPNQGGPDGRETCTQLS